MSRTEQKVLTRRRIVDAAARGFRRSGFGGMGVDGLAKEAGVTSGAFYVHFDSKSSAFREAVSEGMRELKDGVLQFQTTHGKEWWAEFVRFYLGFKRTCDLAESCTLQSLSPEVARSDEVSRAAFEAGLRGVAEAILAGPRSPGAPKHLDAACAALAALVGAVTLGRAVRNRAFSNQIAESTGRALLGARFKLKRSPA
ncbi:TetR family transcriptional regulator [Betaproteobacteria bacterium GR16-43]|nr:TetR family transcriptional regulator [Betaproteobacteria bacterium GR16-43]